VESISYLSVASMKIETQRLGFATACMWCLNGEYPTQYWLQRFEEQGWKKKESSL
jgi:glutamine phosphoribosylpyrophosphate amidotransferase